MAMMVYACSSKKTESAQSETMEENPDITMTIGTYTDATSEGIYAVDFNTKTGELSGLKLMAKSPSPSYLAWSPGHGLLYAVNELEGGQVSAYKYEGDTLIAINEAGTNGIHPCYVDVNDKGDKVAVANYSSGNGAVFELKEDGSIADSLFTYQHSGNGPNADRQEAPHAHCSIFSPDGRFVYVVDLGIDQVKGYPTAGQSIGSGFTALELEPGDGPRHLIFHPNKLQAFLINELSNTVVSLAIDTATGIFKVIDRESTIPEDFTEHSQCADIHLSSDGKFLYGSNRGHNSIAIFSVAETGKLERIGVEPVHGEWPRNFTLSPDEKFLLVANKDTDNIAIFSRDAKTGMLTYTGNQMSLSKPVCLKF